MSTLSVFSPSRGFRCSFALAAVAGMLVPVAVDAAPALRRQVDQRGSVVLIGNTLGHDCAGAPLPLAGTVGACGRNTADTSMDVLWQADDPVNGATASTGVALVNARTSAMLAIPDGARLTYARLYWAGVRATNVADTTVTLDRQGGFTATVTADVSKSALARTQDVQYVYYASADVTATVLSQGPGSYRVGGVETIAPANLDARSLYAGWALVAFYALDSDPPRNLAIFDGLDQVYNSTATATLGGFVVPNSGFDATLGIVAFEGDESITGDQFLFNGSVLTDALNPANNFFNGTRSRLGRAFSSAGDLPRLSGEEGTLSGLDLDVIDVTARLSAGATSATISGRSDGDLYVLNAFVTAVATLKPIFTTTSKAATDLNGGDLVAGDELEYAITTRNTGTDASEDTVVTDVLPSGITYKAGTLTVTTGSSTTSLSDAAGDDRGEYDATTRTVRVRIGTGATATAGGSVAVSDPPITLKFRVIVNANSTGPIANQALVTAAGRAGKPQGVPPVTFESDTEGTGQRRPTTVTVTPDTKLVTTPPVATRDTNATFTFTSTDGAATFECALDGAAFAACSTPRNLTGLSTATHTFAVRARTATAVDPTPASWTWVVDPNAPAAPVILAPVAGGVVSSSTPTISGTSEPGATVSVSVDGGPAITTTAGADGSWSVTSTPLGTGPHTASATATDASGNTSPATTRGFRVGTVGIDTTFTSTPPAASSSTSATFGFAATEAGGTFECALDNAAFAACATPRALTGLTDGNHTFRVRAVDTQGVADTSPASWTWTVDTRAPVAPAITSPANGSRVNVRQPPLRGTGEPGTTVNVLIDGTSVGRVPVDANGQWSVTPGTPLGEGNHVITATATDAAGNAGPSATSSFTVDLTAPDTTIARGPSGSANPPDAAFTFLSSEAGSVFECSLDGASYGRCLASTQLNGLSEGPHVLAVRAIDPAGNIDPTPASRQWNVGTTDGDGDGLPDEEETRIGTNPRVADTDGDGLSDGVEVRRTRTDPKDDDDDDDGLLDGHEDRNGDGILGPGETAPRNADTDGDGLTDGVEMALSAPEGQDTNRAVFVADLDPSTSTDPRSVDTDGGSVWDGIEDRNHDGKLDRTDTDPNDPDDDVDADGDGLDNDTELHAGTLPRDSDTDDDGVPDALDGLVDSDNDGRIDALDPDSDGDEVKDGTELGVTAETATAGTDRNSSDFVPDADPSTKTDPKRRDTDQDKLWDGVEDRNHDGKVDSTETDPNDPDTDSGGRTDGAEVKSGTDPLDPLDDYEVAGTGGCNAGGTPSIALAALALVALLRRRRAALGAALLALHAPAFALSSLPSDAAIEVQQFHPGPGGADLLAVSGSSVPGHLALHAGVFANWAHAPLVLVEPGTFDRVANVVNWQAALDVVASIGFFERFELGVTIPAALQSTASSGPFGTLLGSQIPTLGFGDLRIVPKVSIVRLDSGVSFAAAVPVSVPSGASEGFLGGGVASFQPRLIVDWARASGLRVGANAGFTFRTAEHRFANVVVGHDVAWGVGARVPLTSSEHPLAFVANVFGNVNLGASGPAQRPTEALAALEIPFGPGFAATLGAGHGLTAGYGSPDVRVLAGLTWSERLGPIDTDADGVMDPDDKCVTVPEDRDGFADDDGCPELDNDGDGLADTADACPLEKETPNGYVDEDGCPDVAPPSDTDGDGLADGVDQCPKEPEDPDIFDDADGCPDPDNDRDGILDPADKCPLEPETVNEFEDEDGCPDKAPAKDSDGDGVADPDDKCVDVPEDKDGIDDTDGCPDLDDDHDGVDVPQDQCPQEPETINGVNDEDGCPDKGRVLVVVQEKKIVILDKVYFATGKDTILPRSFGLLKQVAQTIKANPQMGRLRVEGHTDDQGKLAMNMDLSQRRANTVREFLVKEGVSRDRLVARGFGPTKPVETNKTPKGREANRRVEFNVIEPGAEAELDLDAGK